MIETFGAVTLLFFFTIIVFKYWTYKLYMMLIIVKPTQLSYTNQLCILHCSAKEPIRYAFFRLFLLNAHTHVHTILVKTTGSTCIGGTTWCDPSELVSGTEHTCNHLNDLCNVSRGKKLFILVPLSHNIHDFDSSRVCWVKNTLLVRARSGRSMKRHRQALTALRSFSFISPKPVWMEITLNCCVLFQNCFFFILTFHYLMLCMYWNAIKTVNFCLSYQNHCLIVIKNNV